MMWQSDIYYLVRKERQQDLLQEIARDQLVQVARQQRSKDQPVSRKIITWLGGQMVKWGVKLQNYNTTLTTKESIS